MNKVLKEIQLERIRQDEKWGGPIQDDKWNAADWHAMLTDYVAWARRMWCMGSLQKSRRRFLQVAALAVAAVESIDRHIERKKIAHKAFPKIDKEQSDG